MEIKSWGDTDEGKSKIVGNGDWGDEDVKQNEIVGK